MEDSTKGKNLTFYDKTFKCSSNESEKDKDTDDSAT